MHVLITYDVATSEEGGKTRLRKVAKACVNRGQRVQNSVFECKLTPAQYVELKSLLTGLIDEETDSLRFYNLGKHWHGRVETIGVDHSTDPDGLLLI